MVNTHHHQCKKCGTIWEHPDSVMDCTEKNITKFHKCPDCGVEERTKYYPGPNDYVKYPYKVNNNV